MTARPHVLSRTCGVARARAVRIIGRCWRSRARRMLVRVVVVYHLVGIAAVLATVPAYADDGTSGDGVPTNTVFSWMELRDSHGISPWRYFMSLDHGSARSPWKLAYSYSIEVEYELYRGIVASTIWLLTYAVSFDWLDLFVTPARSISDALTSMTGQLHLTGTLLTAAALVAGCWMLRGRWATGVYEIIVSCVIAVLAVGVLSNPIERVAGSDGLIMQARDSGLELAAGITHRGNTGADPDQMLDQLSQSMVDTLLRRPTQALNFGQVIDDLPGADGAKCIEAWDRGFDQVKGNTRDTLKDNVRKCEGGGPNLWDGNGGAMKAYADNPGPGQVAAAAALILGGLVLMIFGWALAFTVLASVCSALYQALKAIPVLLFGIAPGAPRGSLWSCAANLAMSLVSIVFAVVFIAGYMLVIDSVFTGSSDNLFKKIFVLDILLVAGMVLFRRGVRAVRSYSDTLAQKMATRPSASPTQIHRSTPTANPLMSAYYTAQLGGQAVRMASRGTRAVRGLAATQKAAAFHGARAATATATTAATAGTAAATYAAWAVVKKAAGGAAVLANAAGQQPISAPVPTKAAPEPADASAPTGPAMSSRRRRPADPYTSSVKRRTGTAMPVTSLHRPAATPATAAPASEQPTRPDPAEHRTPSGLWVPASAVPAAPAAPGTSAPSEGPTRRRRAAHTAPASLNRRTPRSRS